MTSGTMRSGGMFVCIAGLAMLSWGCGGEEQIEQVSLGIGGLGGAGPVTFGGAGLTCVTANRDATIAKVTPDSKLGSSAECVVDGGSTERSCLIQFNVADIPSNAIVNAAFLRLQVFDSSPETFPVYDLQVQWNQANATWNKYTSSLAWGLPGAKASSDRGSIALAAVPGGAGEQWVGFNPSGVAVVQSWVGDPSLNRGIIIANSGISNGTKYRTIEAAAPALPPQLCVSWH